MTKVRLAIRIPIPVAWVICISTSIMTFCTGVARAGVIHPYLGSITSVESTSVVHVAKPGPVAGVNAFTVDDGNLWDAEGAEFRGTFAASSRVDEFNGAGTK